MNTCFLMDCSFLGASKQYPEERDSSHLLASLLKTLCGFGLFSQKHLGET